MTPTQRASLLLFVVFAGCAHRAWTPDLPLAPTPRDAVPPLPAPVDIAPRSTAVSARRLANGLDVYVVERPDLRHVSLAYVTRRGGVEDVSARDGVLTRLVTTALSIESRFRRLPSAGLDAMAPRFQGLVFAGGAALVTSVPSGRVDAALANLDRVLEGPAFDEKVVRRARREVLMTRLDAAQDLEWRAHRLALTALLGEEHPLAADEDQFRLHVAVPTMDELNGARANRFTPEGGAIVLVGPVQAELALAEVERRFGAWQTGTPVAAPPLSFVVGERSERSVRFGHAATTQARAVILLPAPPRGSTDRDACRLLVAALGGGHSARLPSALRSALDVPSEVSVLYHAGRRSGRLTVELAVARERMRDAVDLVLRELERVARDGLSEQELELARARSNERDALARDTAEGALLELIGEVVLEPEPDAHPISAPTGDRASVAHAAARWLRAANATVGVVGDLSGFGGFVRWAGKHAPPAFGDE